MAVRLWFKGIPENENWCETIRARLNPKPVKKKETQKVFLTWHTIRIRNCRTF